MSQWHHPLIYSFYLFKSQHDMLVLPYRVTSQMPVTWFIKPLLGYHLLDIRNINRGGMLRPRHLAVERVGVRECRWSRIIIIVWRRRPQIRSAVVCRFTKHNQMMCGRGKWTIRQAILQPLPIQKKTYYSTSQLQNTYINNTLFVSKPTSLVDSLCHHQILLWNFLSQAMDVEMQVFG